jgi:hypothetical protein
MNLFVFICMWKEFYELFSFSSILHALHYDQFAILTTILMLHEYFATQLKIGR